jgi:murein DD-endopeptidase MepM/ murein hydrolase activator NlpD
MSRTALPLLCACLALLGVPALAAAHDLSSSGGASMPTRPQLKEAQCVSGAPECAQGESVKIRGEYLDTAKTVVFLGRKGRRDDSRVTPTSRSPHRVVVAVPSTAASGPVQVISRAAGASKVGPRVRVAPAPAPAAGVATTGAFPVQGRYDFGTEVNRFGGGRDHKGQDVFARCGTSVVAALAGKVTIAKWQDRAGNYVVIKAADGTSQAYMHLKEPASVAKADEVAAGQPIGLVGDTGRASGCHLHFELWTAPGWYAGGEPIDPLPSLKQWASATPAPGS